MPRENLVVIGLGNPGSQYAMTRHNIGYMIAQALAKNLKLPFKEESKFQALIAKGTEGESKVHIVLPTTYMNLSGQAVRSYLDYLKLDNHSVIVVTDDVALPFGQMKLLASGGTGGHNGLRSIQTHLGSAVYKRLRVGVGSNKELPLEAYVLSPFSAEEREKLPEVIEKSVKIIIRLLTEEFADVMNSVNTRRRPPKIKETENQGDKDESSETKSI